MLPGDISGAVNASAVRSGVREWRKRCMWSRDLKGVKGGFVDGQT
jgi:hypothetical protein